MAGTRLRNVAAEIVGDDFDALVERARKATTNGPDTAGRPTAYIGFEPSGTAHVGWMVCTQTIRELVDTGFDVTILLADWHAQINDKLGGDLAAIQRCGRYMVQAFDALGVDPKRVQVRWASDIAADREYWALVVQVAKATSLARMRRAMTIMGRSEDEGDGDMSKFLYPAMQVADIFYLGVDLAYGGMDQRHAHMLARDVAKRLGRPAPTALHTPLVPSLKGTGRMDATADGATDNKMSKSDPSSGIFLHDTPDEIRQKLRQAHCIAKEVDGNPVLDLLRLVVWPRLTGPFVVPRPEKFGGPRSFADPDAVVAAFAAGDLHPADLKAGVAEAMVAILAPVAAYFETHPDDLAFVQALRRTR